MILRLWSTESRGVNLARFVLHSSGMASTNSSGNDEQKSFGDMPSSAVLTKGIHNQLIMCSAVNSFFSITAFLGNTLILVALHKDSSLHPPSKLLFRNLAANDLCVGVIVEPLFVTYFISVLNKRWDICPHAFDIVHLTGYILSAVSLFTMTAISVDRLLALLLGLRYGQVVTLKRMRLTVTLSWVVSTIGSTLYLRNHHITLRFSNSVISVCLLTSFFCYTKIFIVLRHNQVQAQGNINQGQPSQIVSLNRARYRKTVSSVLWVQLTVVACYLPRGIVELLVLQRGLSPSLLLVRYFTATLIFLNSSLNPILYCWKIREVRQAVKDTLRGFCCSSS